MARNKCIGNKRKRRIEKRKEKRKRKKEKGLKKAKKRIKGERKRKKSFVFPEQGRLQTSQGKHKRCVE